MPRRWRESPTGSRIVSIELPQDLNISDTTVLGGICSLFTADWNSIRDRRIRFASAGQFAEWLESWYPRLDQIYGCVGVPPPGVKQVCYVVEDSFFAERMARLYPNWDQGELTAIFKNVHKRFGEPAVRTWLAEAGFRDAAGNCRPLTVVYTSEIQEQLETGLRCFELSVAQALRDPRFCFKAGDRTTAAINMMYTPYWPAVLVYRKTD